MRKRTLRFDAAVFAATAITFLLVVAQCNAQNLYPRNPILRVGTNEPIWVPASHAEDRQGSLQLFSFSKEAERRFRDDLREAEKAAQQSNKGPGTTRSDAPENSETCLNLAESISPPSLWRNRGIADIADGAAAIYRGTVIATHPGFFMGHPGSLVEVEVTKEIKSNPYLRPPLEIYFYTFNGSFSAGQYDFCNSHPSAPYLAQSGDQALVFIETPPKDPEGRVFVVNDVVYETQAGEMIKTMPLLELNRPGVPIPESIQDLEELINKSVPGYPLGHGEEKRDSQ